MRHIGLDVHNKSTMIYWYEQTTGELFPRAYWVATPELVAHIATHAYNAAGVVPG